MFYNINSSNYQKWKNYETLHRFKKKVFVKNLVLAKSVHFFEFLRYSNSKIY